MQVKDDEIMNYENYTLNDEEFKDGINNFFTQLLRCTNFK